MFDVTQDTPEIKEIAHALSNLCRFNGHCRFFYSVAEHCVNVSKHAPDEFALWGLLHDAAEAYVGDHVTPLKTQQQKEIERDINERIALAFNLQFPIPKEIHEIDLRMLATEAYELMPSKGTYWSLLIDVPRIDDVSIAGREPWFAKEEFLLRFEELTQ